MTDMVDFKVGDIVLLKDDVICLNQGVRGVVVGIIDSYLTVSVKWNKVPRYYERKVPYYIYEKWLRNIQDPLDLIHEPQSLRERKLKTLGI